MAVQVSSFQQLIDLLASHGLDTEQGVPIAERFMEATGVDFDADGNFAPMSVSYEPALGALKKD